MAIRGSGLNALTRALVPVCCSCTPAPAPTSTSAQPPIIPATTDSMHSMDTFYHLQDEIEEVIAGWITEFDPERRLTSAEAFQVLAGAANRFLALVTMDTLKRIRLDDSDRKFLEDNVWLMVKPLLDQKVPLRFIRGDHVVCNVDGAWTSGSVVLINEKDPQRRISIPYVVQLDPPGKRMVPVYTDDNSMVRAEVCFRQGSQGLLLALSCLPPMESTRFRRFSVGERVACAIDDTKVAKDATDTVWSAGTVIEVNASMEAAAHELLPDRQWQHGAPCVPYRVKLDLAEWGTVLVHKDEHWLIRDLEHQAEGIRQAKCGKRCLARLAKRKREGTWEVVDHMTRQVRSCGPIAPDDQEVATTSCCEKHNCK